MKGDGGALSIPLVCGVLASLALQLCTSFTPAALAVGLEGPEDARLRVGVGIGTGWDQVGGIGRDAYPFAETYGHADWRPWRGLAIGAAVTVREDLADYNFALSRWRGRSTGLAAQLAVGYDGPTLHLSVGPWLYGDARDGRDFRLGVLPWGVIRARAGHLDRWHVNLRILDGSPFTAEGAGTGIRLQLGAPPRGRHRLAGGLYTSLGEKTLGVSFTDDIAAATRSSWSSTSSSTSSVRVGGLLGTDYGYFAARPELTLFAGLVW